MGHDPTIQYPLLKQPRPRGPPIPGNDPACELTIVWAYEAWLLARGYAATVEPPRRARNDGISSA